MPDARQTLWYASLSLRTALVAACDRLKVRSRTSDELTWQSVGTLAEDRATDLLAKLDAMLPQISHVFARSVARLPLC